MHFEIANPKPQHALKSWHAVRPAYAYVCLSIAVSKKSALCSFVQCINPKPLAPQSSPLTNAKTHCLVLLWLAGWLAALNTALAGWLAG